AGTSEASTSAADDAAVAAPTPTPAPSTPSTRTGTPVTVTTGSASTKDVHCVASASQTTCSSADTPPVVRRALPAPADGAEAAESAAAVAPRLPSAAMGTASVTGPTNPSPTEA